VLRRAHTRNRSQKGQGHERSLHFPPLFSLITKTSAASSSQNIYRKILFAKVCKIAYLTLFTSHPFAFLPAEEPLLVHYRHDDYVSKPAALDHPLARSLISRYTNGLPNSHPRSLTDKSCFPQGMLSGTSPANLSDLQKPLASYARKDATESRQPHPLLHKKPCILSRHANNCSWPSLFPPAIISF
jgi:hypothetical protein